MPKRFVKIQNTVSGCVGREINNMLKTKNSIEELEGEIRDICTYHSDGGTSGYNLSEEQFSKLLALFKKYVEKVDTQAREEELEKIQAVRSGYAYDDYSSLYQHSNELYAEYFEQEGKLIIKRLADLKKEEV